jgi:benzoate/toluate 1,2-dioxygenase subunit beta
MTTSYENVCAVLFQEARLLDDRDWDSWLEMYDPQAEYWAPAWADDGELTDDPQTQVSLIYYPNRGGLEDRVFRIRTDRSSATIPDTRTSHNITNVEIVERNGDVVKVRHNWVTYSVRYNHTDTFAGTSFVTIDFSDAKPVIKAKKVIIKTDYIRHVLDVYHL